MVPTKRRKEKIMFMGERKPFTPNEFTQSLKEGRSNFEGIVVLGSAELLPGTVGQDLCLREATVLQDLVLSRVSVPRNLDLRGAEINGDLFMNDTKVSGDVLLEGLKLRGQIFTNLPAIATLFFLLRQGIIVPMKTAKQLCGTSCGIMTPSR